MKSWFNSLTDTAILLAANQCEFINDTRIPSPYHTAAAFIGRTFITILSANTHLIYLLVSVPQGHHYWQSRGNWYI